MYQGGCCKSPAADICRGCKFSRQALHGGGCANAAEHFLDTPKFSRQALHGGGCANAANISLCTAAGGGLCNPLHSFSHLPHQHNRAQSDTSYGLGSFPVLNVMFLRFAIRMQNIHRTDGSLIFQNSTAKHCIPSA